MHKRSDKNTDWTRRNLLTMAAMAPALAMAMTSAAKAALPQEVRGKAAELPPDLVRAVNAYDQATRRNDTATLGELVAEDYVLVNSDSSLQNKQEYLDDFTLPGFRIDPYEIEQPLQRVWGDTALTGGVLHLGWIQESTHHRRTLRVAHVWIKHAGRWQITYTQLTRIPEETT